MPKFQGVVPPVVTPYNADFSVDYPSYTRVLEHLIDGGCHGLFVLGSTSEVTFFDEATRALLDPGFLPLDNTANRRPEWYELWVIREFLRVISLVMSVPVALSAGFTVAMLLPSSKTSTVASLAVSSTALSSPT